MLTNYINIREALKCLRTDNDGVVSFEYIIVAACIIGAVVAAFGTGAGGAIATALSGGITAITGDYGYEPNGVIHDMTNFPEDTIIYFTNFGPIRYIDDDNNTVGLLDWQGILKAAEDGAAKIT